MATYIEASTGLHEIMRLLADAGVGVLGRCRVASPCGTRPPHGRGLAAASPLVY
jgi:hypothetical protein